jgi:hypothetical protein
MENSICKRNEIKKKTFLSRKRKGRDLSENFIFRQTFTGNLEGEYEKGYVASIGRMKRL